MMHGTMSLKFLYFSRSRRDIVFLIKVLSPTDVKIIRKLAIHAPSSEELRAFTIGELNGAVKHLHPRKAPGPDQITTLMIR